MREWSSWSCLKHRNDPATKRLAHSSKHSVLNTRQTRRVRTVNNDGAELPWWLDVDLKEADANAVLVDGAMRKSDWLMEELRTRVKTPGAREDTRVKPSGPCEGAAPSVAACGLPIITCGPSAPCDGECTKVPNMKGSGIPSWLRNDPPCQVAGRAPPCSVLAAPLAPSSLSGRTPSMSATTTTQLCTFCGDSVSVASGAPREGGIAGNSGQ